MDNQRTLIDTEMAISFDNLVWNCSDIQDTYMATTIVCGTFNAYWAVVMRMSDNLVPPEGALKIRDGGFMRTYFKSSELIKGHIAVSYKITETEDAGDFEIPEEFVKTTTFTEEDLAIFKEEPF